VSLAAPWTIAKTSINSDLVLVIDGQKVFPIGFTTPPPPDGLTPAGTNGIAELADAGATFLRTGGPWSDEAIKREEKYLDVAARYGLHCLPFLREHSFVDTAAREKALRELINRFKNHPGLGAWKGDDEPAWAKKPLAPLVRAYEIIKETDPDHPIVLIHAPRDTTELLRKYNVTGDIVGMDVYPIAYPPAHHSIFTNENISVVGDHTRQMVEVGEGKKPVWMVLQISWSGVLKPGRTLRFPTFPEERFMTYQAIIAGARGLIYFGGNNEGGMCEEDKKLGWNWTFWKRVLRPVIEEIGSKSPLYPALVAPESKLAIKGAGKGIEYCVREAGNDLFVLACKREGGMVKAEFSGLPKSAHKGDVLYEAPRFVEASQGKFTDWFAPFEVHVYRFHLQEQPL
jgi:hypothetical protein